MANSSQPGQSSVVTYYPDGTQPRYLGQFGHVSNLIYSYALPGGPDQMSCVLNVEPMYRVDAMNAGRIVKIFRGGSQVWDGILLEPTPAGSGTTGWTISAQGAGTYGNNFDSIYTTWTNQNDAVNQAISRGLRWSNPGIPSGVWLGQQQDSGSETITDLLNLFCTMGGYVWYVSRGNVLNVIPFSTTPVTRVLTCATPVPRTLGGFINSLWGRYQTSPSTASVPTYGLVNVKTAASVAKHGTQESYVDLSNAGQLTSAAATALLQSVLNRYQAISYAGPFTVRYGEYLLPGGQPVDLGQEHAGQVVRLIMTDFGYGGEVVPDPVTFLIGNYEYDDEAQTATITPFQSLDTSLTGLLGTLAQTGGTAAQEKPKPPKRKPTHHKKRR